MSGHPDLDVRLEDWLRAEAPDHAPAHLRGALADRLDRTSQESYPAVLPHALPLRGAWLLAVAAILVAATVGAAGWIPGLRAPWLGGGVTPVPRVSPSSPPSPSPSPSPSEATCPDIGMQGAPLPQARTGPTVTRAFEPQLGFTMPRCWQAYFDRTGEFAIAPPDAGHVSGRPTTPQGAVVVAPDNFFSGGVVWDGIAGYRDPVPISPDGRSTVTGVAATSQGLARWLTARPELVATAPKSVTIAGLAGFQVDIRLSSKAPGLCGGPCADLFRHGETSGTWTFGIAGPEQARIYLLDEATGPPIMLVVDDVDGVDTAGLFAEAAPIIASMHLVTSP